MNEVKLVLPDESHKEKYLKMMDEWISFGGRLNPAALKNNGASYEEWLGWMKDDQNELTCPEGAVPQTLYFAFNEDDILLGAVTVRHYLNERMFIDGGYVGYGVRPSQRRKGYAKKMLALAINKVKEMGVENILITCAADNTGSMKTILANGGVFENEMFNEYGELVKRFWIYCEEK
jgi:predicted acetyltransferase